MDYPHASSLVALFFAQAKALGDKPFLWRKQTGAWQSQSWAEVAETVGHLARGLRSLGLADGGRVLLVSENRPEWLMADVAVMAAGGITVPAYTTNTIADHLHLLDNSGAEIAIVSTAALAERLLAAAQRAAHPPLVICLEPPALKQNPGLELRFWGDVILLGQQRDEPLSEPTRRDTACLIYTSGTGGAPKGVMQSHGSILSNCEGACQVLAEIGLGDDVFLSFLPLSHAYEHTAGQAFPIFLGAQIYYAESLEQLGANMAEVHPTIMTAVPRLYELMRTRILKGVEKAGGLKAHLFHRALALGSRNRLRWLERLENRLLDRLVRAKVAQRFGGRLKAMVSGGAPLNYEVGQFFTALGVRILQGYGQTESGPVISVNRPGQVALESVGPPMAGVTLRLAEDGEICVQGELVMNGYWNDPQATNQVLRDGWLHTGDIGRLDDRGRLVITDRKKDIIVNSGGDNISPQRIEGFLTLQPEIAQAMVYGDRRPHLVALLVPDLDFAKAQGLPTEISALIVDERYRKLVAQALERVNRDLSPIEKVRRFTFAAEPFTVDNGMATPTLKIRRHVIRGEYGPALEALYS